jgi:Sulfotransferase family
MRDNSTAMSARPIFVVGSPRSGTTMIGNYLGSARSVLNAGEYRALYLAYGALPVQMGAAHRLAGLAPPEWEPFRAQYVDEVQRHSAEFIARIAEHEGYAAFCDSFPRNVLIGNKLAEIFPDALFVLTLRHYTGTIQSLLRLGTINLLPANEVAVDWVDPTAVAAAVLWARHYQASFRLPNDRTVVFGYDRFCADPEPTLRRFKARLAAAGFPVDELDDSRFTESHATEPGKPRATAGRRSGKRIRLAAIPSFNPATWSEINEYEVAGAVLPTDQLLRSIFPDDYAEPAGYRGPATPSGEAPAAIEPTPPAAEAGSPGATPATRRRGSAPPPAPARRPARPQVPGADKPARGRRATGR